MRGREVAERAKQEEEERAKRVELVAERFSKQTTSLLRARSPEEESRGRVEPLAETGSVVTNHEKKIEALASLSNGLVVTGSAGGELKFWDWRREAGRERAAELLMPSRAAVRELL